MTKLSEMLVKELGKALEKTKNWKAYAKMMGEEVNKLNREIRTLKRKQDRTVPGHIFYYTIDDDNVLL